MADAPRAQSEPATSGPAPADLAGDAHSGLPSAIESLLARTQGLNLKLLVLVLIYTAIVGVVAWLLATPGGALDAALADAGLARPLHRQAIAAVALLIPAGGLAFILFGLIGAPLAEIRESLPGHDWQPVQSRAMSDYTNLRSQVRSMGGDLKAVRDDRQKLVAELDLLHEQQKSAGAALAAAVALTRDSLILTDELGKVRDLSPSALEILRLNRADAMGRAFAEVVRLYDANHAVPTEHPLPDVALRTLERRTNIPQLQQAVLVTGEGQQMSTLVGATAILDHRSNVAGALVRIEPYGVVQAEAAAPPRGTAGGEDALTGLLNGPSFDKRMEMLINVARTQSARHSLLFVSLDNFEEVCAGHTHWAGEELLWQLAQLLRTSVPDGAEVFRVSSVHFAVVLPFTTAEPALATAERLRVAVEGREFKWGEKKFESTISIGVVPVLAESEGPKVLLGYANRALASAKARGGNSVAEHTSDAKVEAQRKDDRQWVVWLNRSLRQGRAHIISQLIEPLAADVPPEPLLEVLLRIEDEDGVWITPAAFLPSVVRHNLTSQLDLWMLRRLMQVLQQTPSLLEKHGLISLNIARPSITEHDFADRVVEVLAETRIPADRLCFEVEAMVAISHPSEFARFVNTVRPSGARFALDKCKAALGLNALMNLPVDYVKIHEALVKSALDNPLDQAYLEWINSATHKLQRRTIATGVEDQRTLDLLRRIGVDYAQGVHINKLGPLMA